MITALLGIATQLVTSQLEKEKEAKRQIAERTKQMAQAKTEAEQKKYQAYGGKA